MSENDEIDPRANPRADNALSNTLLEMVTQSLSLKRMKRGANEVTKSIMRSQAQIVIIAANTEPLEIILHLTILCEDKNIQYIFINSKEALGKACGVTRSVIAASILKDERKRDPAFDTQVEKVMKKIDAIVG